MSERYVVVFRLMPRGGNRSYVVIASSPDEAIDLAITKLEPRLPASVGWKVVGATAEPLR